MNQELRKGGKRADAVEPARRERTEDRGREEPITINK
jgi:hypothetical protein